MTSADLSSQWVVAARGGVWTGIAAMDIPGVKESYARLVGSLPALVRRLEQTRRTVRGYLDEEWDGNEAGWQAVADAIDTTLEAAGIIPAS